MKFCNKCGEIILGGWEHDDRCNGGSIELHRSCQIFNPYAKGCGLGPNEGMNVWDKLKKHPAVSVSTAQLAEVQWGNDGYRLCYDCNDLLIEMVGKFFGLTPHYKLKTVETIERVEEK